MKNKDQDYSICKRLWSKEEDQLLVRIVGKQNNPKWTFISQEFNEVINVSTSSTHVSRTNKQCRQRWQNHLNPSLKNHLPWSEDEHRALFKLFKQFSHQWCELATKLQSQGFQRRGENNIKNYFYSAIKRQIKRINEVIRQSNKQTKRKKSQKNQYRKKYVYNPRLSLQRQFLVRSTQSRQQMSQEKPENAPQNPPKRTNEQSLHCNINQSSKEQPKQQEGSAINQQNNLHIIKQLDYQLISKILLIAEEKGGKKFVISSNITKQCHQEAEQLRNMLIQLIIQRQKPIDSQYVRELAIKMLKMSRKCKRKTQKMGNQKEQNHQFEDLPQITKTKEDLPFITKNKAKSSQEVTPTINIPKEQNDNSNAFDEKAQLQKRMKIDDKVNFKSAGFDIMRNSQQYRMDQGYNNPHLSISLDSRHFMDNRNFIDRSWEYMNNSNFSMVNYLKDSSEINSVKQAKSPINFISQFINDIREVPSKEEISMKPAQFSFPHSGFFPIYDSPFCQTQNKSMYSSQPILSSNHSSQLSSFKSIKPNSQSNQSSLLRSCAFPYENFELPIIRNIFQSKQDFAFNFPSFIPK